MRLKTNWLDRRIAAPGPYLTLCLFETEFMAATKHLNAGVNGPWISPGKSGTMHVFTNPDSALTCVVCLDGWQGRNPVEVAGLLVHEAVHVWQEYVDGIGERYPGTEQEAYAIQCIAQELMAEFAARLAGPIRAVAA